MFLLTPGVSIAGSSASDLHLTVLSQGRLPLPGDHSRYTSHSTLELTHRALCTITTSDLCNCLLVWAVSSVRMGTTPALFGAWLLHDYLPSD